MKISAFDLKRQIAPFRKEIDSAIKSVIDSTSFILGDRVRRFEENAAKYSQAKYAIGVSNGSDSISLSLLALGVKEGDSVICPSFTYYATAGAIAAIGAFPVFADIDPKTYNISLESVSRILDKKKKRKIKAIIPVHLYGQPCDIKGIIRLAQKYNLKVIEDTAQAFGAKFKGKKAGTFGDCGSVSFYPGKNLGAFGDAGLILTNSRETSRVLKILRNQGNENMYDHILLGRNNRMDAIQAAVLDIKLKYLDKWNIKRAELAGFYNDSLRGAGCKLPFVLTGATHTYHQYVLRIENGRNKLVDYLQKRGIDSRIFYPIPLHLQKCFRYLGYRKGDLPEAEKAALQTFTLPIDPGISAKERDYIMTTLKEYLNG